MEGISAGDTAWVLASAALVMLMTPGLGFFYGGLVQKKNVLSTLMHSFFTLALVSLIWVLWGYSLAFGPSMGGVIGGLDFFGLNGITPESTTGTIPTMAFVGFQMMFAAITPALISGAFAERKRFKAFVIFTVLWSTIVYAPVAHWVWGGGWIAELGALDFAGGTVIHITSGVAAIVVALMLGRRKQFGTPETEPHDLTMTVLGAALLWFGWFGFNAGAEGTGALGGETTVGLIVLNTLGATAAAIIGWLIIEKVKDGKATSVGAASGAVAGLVAITPACADLAPGWALVLGFVVGIVCALAIELKWKLGYDDSLDVVGIHLVGGIIGTIYLGFFATGTGLFLGGGIEQLVVQVISALAVLVYSFIVAWLLGFAIEKTLGFRVKNEDEIAGVDTVIHGEEGYAIEAR